MTHDDELLAFIKTSGVDLDGPIGPFNSEGLCGPCSKVRDNVDNARGLCPSCAMMYDPGSLVDAIVSRETNERSPGDHAHVWGRWMQARNSDGELVADVEQRECRATSCDGFERRVLVPVQPSADERIAELERRVAALEALIPLPLNITYTIDVPNKTA